MSDEIIKILDILFERFGITIDWTTENIMPYVQTLMVKYVRYEMWTSIIEILVSIAVTVALFFITRALYKAYKKDKYDSDLDYPMIVSGVAFVAVAVVTIVCVLINVETVVCCLTFPEKVFIDYLLTLGK